MELPTNFDFSLDEDAVSPVVGVILMVAITVILAAVIGTFVLDLGGQVQQNAQAGVTFDETEGTSVTVQLNSVQSADQIYVESSAAAAHDYNTATAGTTANVSGGVASGDYEYRTSMTVENFLLSSAGGGAGTIVTVDGDAYSSGETVTVIGVLDGSESVIQTYTMA